jgi:hypothetical protein
VELRCVSVNAKLDLDEFDRLCRGDMNWHYGLEKKAARFAHVRNHKRMERRLYATPPESGDPGVPRVQKQSGKCVCAIVLASVSLTIPTHFFVVAVTAVAITITVIF